MAEARPAGARRASVVRQVSILLGDSLRASLPTMMAVLGLLFAFFTLGTYLFSTFGETNRDAMNSLSPDFLIALFGGALGGLQPVDLWLITLFVHPLVMVSLVALTVVPPTRDLTGRIDRGILDLLLGCPLPRWTLPLASWIAGQVALALLCGVVWGAAHAGGWILGSATVAGRAVLETLPSYGPVLAQLWLLGQVILGVSVAVAAGHALYGRAMARILGFVVFSYFLNLLAGIWQAITPLQWLSIFHYYQPQPILSGQSQLLERCVLAAVALAALAVSLLRFQRRDIEGV